jgi:hypothetical protein
MGRVGGAAEICWADAAVCICLCVSLHPLAANAARFTAVPRSHLAAELIAAHAPSVLPTGTVAEAWW